MPSQKEEREWGVRQVFKAFKTLLLKDIFLD